MLWHLVAEARNAVRRPTMQRSVPTTKNFTAPNVNSAEVDKWDLLHLFLKAESLIFSSQRHAKVPLLV